MASAAMFTGCPGGGGSGSGQTPIAGVPVGTIYAYNDQNTYCSFDQNNRTYTCYARSYNGQTCTTPTTTFSDLNNLCQQVSYQLQQGSLGGQCNVTSALQRIQTDYCRNNSQWNPNNPWNNNNNGNLPNQNLQQNIKQIQCDFQAQRSNGGYFNSQLDTGARTQTFQVNPTLRSEILLHTSLFNIGAFGKVKLIYNPAGLRDSADTITLSIDGLNKETSIRKTGFAGQKVSIEAQNADGSMNLTIACEGKSQFNKNVRRRFSKLVCQGTSDLSSRRQRVSFSQDYNSNLLNQDFELASGLVMRITGDTRKADNAVLELKAEDSFGDQLFRTTSYLKTQNQMKIDTAYGSADITCTPQ